MSFIASRSFDVPVVRTESRPNIALTTKRISASGKTTFLPWSDFLLTRIPVGLGLAFVKRIVELHGSTVRATSRDNEGAQFGSSLPVRQVA